MMNGAWYFKHDYSARNDQKLVELEMEMGVNIGYALWFKLLEVMGEAGGTMPKAKEKLFAHAMRIDLQMLNSLIGICVRIGLLFDDGEEYVNTRFRDAHNKIAENSAKNSKNAATRWAKGTKTDPKSPNLEPKNPQNDPKCVKTDPKDANLGESEHKKEPKKAKGEPKDDPETDASKAVKAHIAALEDDFGAKNISNMSNVECAKIQAKYGAMTAYALRTYFLWKVSKGKRGGKDYLSLLAKWVQEEVEKESAKPHVETVVLPSKTPEEIALGEERRKMILERAGFGK